MHIEQNTWHKAKSEQYSGGILLWYKINISDLQ